MDDSATATAARRELITLADAVGDAMVVADVEGRVVHANVGAAALGATYPGDLVELAAPDDQVHLRAAMSAAHRDGIWRGPLHLAATPHSVGPVAVTVVALGDGGTALIARVAQGREPGVRDALTGLAGRTLLVEALSGALARMSRNGHRPAVLFLDLDSFKAVNDGLGHEAGDELLVLAARRLEQCVRSSDVVARFGGDEFVIVAEDVADEATVQIIADRVLVAFDRSFELAAGSAHVGASIGIALARPGTTGPDELLAEADAAMYRAKRAGKHRYQICDDDLRAGFAARAELRDNLAGALERGELLTTFTPVADAGDGHLAALEAGLRWRHPTRGVLGPADFVPLARRHGLARELDRFVLREAARAAGTWNASQAMSPATSPALTVWVTVGAFDLLAGELETFLAGVIESAAIGPGSLGIEVPLATLTRHPVEAERVLQSIAWHGARVAVDDFGLDPFSPSQLQRFHIDTVKLDRRLVTDATRVPESLAMLAGVVAMMRALGVTVVAKGVESNAQLELLQELGCALVQGRVVAEPQPAAAIDGLLAVHAPWSECGWPAAPQLAEPMTRMQVLERLFRLRGAA